MHPDATSQEPLFSVIIAVYDDWKLLEGCLRSLSEQVCAPSFEVVVVDDGSDEQAPEAVRQWEKCYPLSIVRQDHAGIPTARNRGVRQAKSPILLFTDSDCRFERDCMARLQASIVAHSQHNCFQLHLAGNCSTLVGRAEQLRLIALQDQTLQPDGRIRLLNTSGFAIRRSHPSVPSGPFDATAIRGEDTLLLAGLMEHGELPLFVPDATVRHAVSLSFPRCILKDLRSGWLEGITFRAIAAKRVRIRMGNKDRIRMLVSTWKTSRQPSIGHAAWAVLISRQLAERTVTVLYQCLPGK